MTDRTDTVLDVLLKDATAALDNAMSVRKNEQYRVKLLQLCPNMIAAITALRAERDALRAILADDGLAVYREDAAYRRGVDDALAALEASPRWMETPSEREV